MFSGLKITALLTGEILEGSVAKDCVQWGILSTLLCCRVVDEVKGGLDGNGRYTLGYVICSSSEISHISSQSFFRRF
jgi:hypothetical protein